MDLSTFSYQNLALSALDVTRLRTSLLPHPSEEKFKHLKAKDNKTTLNTTSFYAPKLRLLRSMTIESQTMQVFDLAAFSEPEYDLPIFCANAFTTPTRSIVVLDLNPLYDVTIQRDYKEKYYRTSMPLVKKYVEIFPWGGKITSESLKFFSPIVIWTTFSSTKVMLDLLGTALMDYYKIWLELLNRAVPEEVQSKISHNREAQHRYLTWRAEKDPGYSLLKKMFGEIQAEDLLRNFLFEGVDTLGEKTFLDYFPEYLCEDGKVSQKRSMIGKSYEKRPWNDDGDFIGRV